MSNAPNFFEELLRGLANVLPDLEFWWVWHSLAAWVRTEVVPWAGRCHLSSPNSIRREWMKNPQGSASPWGEKVLICASSILTSPRLPKNEHLEALMNPAQSSCWREEWKQPLEKGDAVPSHCVSVPSEQKKSQLPACPKERERVGRGPRNLWLGWVRKVFYTELVHEDWIGACFV